MLKKILHKKSEISRVHSPVKTYRKLDTGSKDQNCTELLKKQQPSHLRFTGMIWGWTLYHGEISFWLCFHVSPSIVFTCMVKSVYCTNCMRYDKPLHSHCNGQVQLKKKKKGGGGSKLPTGTLESVNGIFREKMCLGWTIIVLHILYLTLFILIVDKYSIIFIIYFSPKVIHWDYSKISIKMLILFKRLLWGLRCYT